jgi:tetratricopeptide (TPR) repeat protein
VAGLSAPPETGRARVADAFGIAGTGKSWLIGRVKDIWRSRGEAVVFQLDLPASAPTTQGQAFSAFLERVGLLAEELARTSGREGTLAAFDNELRTIDVGAIDIRQAIHAENVTIGDNTEFASARFELSSNALEDIYYGSRTRAVTSKFVEVFRPTLKQRTLVLSLGEYDPVAGSDLVHWLLLLLASLPNTLVLIERSPGTAKLPVPAEETAVPLFTRDEVGALLARCLDDAAPDPALVDTVYQWSDGHPATVALAGRFLRTLGSADVKTFVEKLRSLPGDLAEERARIAMEICGVGEPPLLRTAAIPRRFKEGLLAALLGDLPSDAIDRLLETQVVQVVGDPDAGVFRVQGYVREPLLKLLSAEKRKLLHDRAAAYYYEQLCADEPDLDEDALSYEGWYRYEKPAWQETLREWLYHLGEAAQTDKEREKARRQFTRIFLDAFWWWGCYIEFQFCDDLLKDWERARSDDAEWLQDLRQFLDAYPIGWRKAGEGNWLDVEAALFEIKESCGIEADPAELEGHDARHTRGLVDNFTAHSCRYRVHADDAARDRHYERAVRYYREAAELFAKESWELAWTLFETAELHADFGQLEAAREAWRQAVALAIDEADPELIANLHRLRADIRWLADAKADSFDSHGRALLHAYLFQCKTPSHRPDAYTLAFYLEQVERAHERLKTLEGAELADAFARLRAPFLEYVPAAGENTALSGDYLELLGTVLPAAPKPDELLSTRSELSRRIDVLAEDVGDVSGDLEGVDP